MKQGNKTRIMILLLVALLILVIALINYINISSSNRIEKLKQIGIQKVTGASRFNIFLKIILEGQYTFLVSVFLAVLITFVITPHIKQFTGIDFNVSASSITGFYFILFLVTTSVAFVSVLFPALRFSSLRPVDNLKKSASDKKPGTFSRKALVISQFIIAIALISFTMLVQKQVKFGCSELGYNNENIMAIKINDQLLSKRDVLRNHLLEYSSVSEVSFAQFYPGKVILNYNTRSFRFKNGEDKDIEVRSMDADTGFLHLMGLELVKGRFFSDDFSTDKGKVIVNESFLRENEITADPIGATFRHGQYDSEIIGVIKDFHFEPLNKPISSLVITNSSPNHLFLPLYCLFKVQTSDFNSLHGIVEDLKEISSRLSPDYPIELSFMSDAVENMYKNEIQFGKTFSLFSGFAIFISCLGIFALSLADSQRRTKEIGIRKVNGAKVSEILALLNKDFIKWVVVAFAIATPIAWYAMIKWLENFAYKTTLSWWIFALTGLLALGITLLTVSWQSWRAATRNPVEALRYE